METNSQEDGAGEGGATTPGPEVDLSPGRSGSNRPPSDELRASLAAVRAAREAAQARLRRDSRRVRVAAVVCVAAFVAGAVVMMGHVRRARRINRASGAGVVLDLAPRVALAAPSASAPADEGMGAALAPSAGRVGLATAGPAPSAGSTPAAAGEPPAADAAPSAGAAALAVGARDAESAVAACGDAYDGHHWRAAVDACAIAFEARPREVALAMKVAQAQHARGRYADAGAWARRALALDGVDPEALVILAHAEQRAGRPAAARSAYRRYLVLAPRGWHASEARAAVHGGERVHLRARAESSVAAPAAAPFASSEPTSAADPR